MRRFLFATTLLAAAACRQTSHVDPGMIPEWINTLYGAIRVERLSPPVASRLMTYATTALYSGMAAVDTSMPTLAGVLNGLGELPKAEPGRAYDATVTTVAAKRVVLDSLLREALPTTRAAIARLADSLENARVAAGVEEEVRAGSRELGERIGWAIVAWSRLDGFDSTRGRPYAPPTGVGLWVNDAPATTYASQNLSAATEFVALDNPANIMRDGGASDRGLILNRPKRAGITTLPAMNIAGVSEPYWGQLRPFILSAWNECAVPDPPTYSTGPGSALYVDAQQVYAASRALTPEQRTIALYWADNAGESGTPVGHWMAIASQLVSQRRLSASHAARLMVQTATAQADAFIASWGYKYQYSLIRPRTYIRTMIDSTWEPLIPTPPFPEYPSGHSTQSSAAATVVSLLIGKTAFDDSTSLSIGHNVRRFESFTAAAEEAGLSRVFGGLHFNFGNTGGRELGECVGAKVLERFETAGVR